MTVFGESAATPSDPDWRRLRQNAALGVLRRQLRMRVDPVVAGVVLALVHEEDGHRLKDDLEQVRRFTRMTISGTTAVGPELEQVLFEIHVLPGAEATVVAFLDEHTPYARCARMPLTRQEAEPSAPSPTSGLVIEPWVLDQIASLAGGDGAGCTIVVFDRDFDPGILGQLPAEAVIEQLPVLPEFAEPLPTAVPAHGAAVLMLAHLAAPRAKLQWQFEPRTPDVSMWRASDTAARFWPAAYVSMLRDLHTEGGYPRNLTAPVVVNLSLTWSFGDRPAADESDLAAIIDSVLAPAVADGFVFVACAGNGPPARPMAYPGVSSKVVGIGALDPQGRPAAGSRTGEKSGLWLMAPGGSFGPGSEPVPVAVVDGRPLAGTSYATAIASGLIAGAFTADGQQPPLTAPQVKQLLTDRALPYAGWDPAEGCAGMINVGEGY